MPGKSEIQWTDKTWNPVTGCTQVSPGCDHCYAKTFAERFRGVEGHAYEQGFDLKLWPERLEIPLRWTKPSRIFVNSMSDLFHADVPDDFIVQVFAVMALANQHTFQVLTKRPQRMMRFISNGYKSAAVYHRTLEHQRSERQPWPGWPLPNVWLGTSVETQEYTDRIKWLVKTPAAVRFLSCEPLLGPLDLRDVRLDSFTRVNPLTGQMVNMSGREEGQTGRVDWVIVGGESGNGFRPLDLDWARSIRDQCQEFDVPYFFKQVGGRTPKAGGRDLDGRTWDEMPEVSTSC